MVAVSGRVHPDRVACYELGCAGAPPRVTSVSPRLSAMSEAWLRRRAARGLPGHVHGAQTSAAPIGFDKSEPPASARERPEGQRTSGSMFPRRTGATGHAPPLLASQFSHHACAGPREPVFFLDGLAVPAKREARPRPS
jgi:hypothetical protein